VSPNPDPHDLWPPEIVVEPLTPLEILRRQAEILDQRTGGRLRADVVTTDSGPRSPLLAALQPGEGRVYRVHRFEIVAEALRYRHQVFTCQHDLTLVYPVRVMWTDESGDNERSAKGPAEFEQIVRACLASQQTVSVLYSLLARIRESRNPVPA